MTTRLKVVQVVLDGLPVAAGLEGIHVHAVDGQIIPLGELPGREPGKVRLVPLRAQHVRGH
jgi:hypothetical protein